MKHDDLLLLARQLLDYDPGTGLFIWKVNKKRAKKGDVAGYKMTTGYVKIKINQVPVFAHRLAWAFEYGVEPSVIDHINGEPSDNRICNLRNVTHQINSQNERRARKRKNGGTLLGAHWSMRWKRWKSSIGVDGKHLHLGWFDTQDEAHAAYVQAKRQMHEGCTI